MGGGPGARRQLANGQGGPKCLYISIETHTPTQVGKAVQQVARASFFLGRRASGKSKKSVLN